MTEIKQTVVEYTDPIALAECEYFYVHFQDGLSLVHAIALCHVNQWDFPLWVRNALGEAMSSLYEETFLNVSLQNKSGIRVYSHSFNTDEIKQVRQLYKGAYSKFQKDIKLSAERVSPIDIHFKTARDRAILQLIADYSDFVLVDDSGSFENAFAVMLQLAKALNIDYQTWLELCASNGLLSDNINGHALRAKDVPKECLGVTYDAMKHQWLEFQHFYANERLSVP